MHLSLTLEKAIEKVGVTSFLAADQATFAAAKAAGTSRLTDVLNAAIADGKYDLAAVAASALGSVVDRNALVASGRPHPLVNALYAPGRHLQFAAAKAILNLGSTRTFPGSSRVVPTLARFLTHQTIPRAVVIDANPTRGSQLAGFLIELGYDSELEQTGSQGFVAAASPADVELILISYDLFGQGWPLRDTVANLKADSRTSAIPIYLYGPLNAQLLRPNLKQDYPGIKFLVQPVDSATLKRQLKELPRALNDADRAGYAKEATELLMKIAKDRKGPFAADLPGAEESLVAAMQSPEIAQSAATALAELGSADAQRALADLVLDPSRPSPLRKHVAADLVHSIQRFGPLTTIAQEQRLLSMVREAADSDLQDELEAVVSALRPVERRKPSRPNRRIRLYHRLFTGAAEPARRARTKNVACAASSASVSSCKAWRQTRSTIAPCRSTIAAKAASATSSRLSTNRSSNRPSVNPPAVPARNRVSICLRKVIDGLTGTHTGPWPHGNVQCSARRATHHSRAAKSAQDAELHRIKMNYFLRGW